MPPGSGNIQHFQDTAHLSRHRSKGLALSNNPFAHPITASLSKPDCLQEFVDGGPAADDGCRSTCSAKLLLLVVETQLQQDCTSRRSRSNLLLSNEWIKGIDLNMLLKVENKHITEPCSFLHYRARIPLFER